MTTVRIADIANVIRGVSWDKNEATDTPRDGYLPILRAGNIGDVLNTDDDLVWVPSSNVSDVQRIRAGDIAICMSSGSASVVGKTAAAKTEWPGSLGAFCALLRTDANKCLPEYLGFYLKSTAFRRWTSEAQGANIKNIRKSALEDFSIPLPPIPEQRRIVDLLSHAEGIVRLRREAEKKAAELIPALFLDMFGDPATNPKGWPVVKLADVCGKCATRDPKKQPDEEFTYIDIAAIDNEHGQVSETKTILGMDAPSRARQVVQAGDVIVSTVRPNLRGSAWIPQHLDGQVCSTGFCVLRPSNKTTTGFIYAVIRSDWFVSELMKHVRGAQYPAVSDKNVFRVQIPLPPLSAQQEFSSRLDAVRSIQLQQSMAITKAQATFDALLAQTFS